MGFFSRIQQLWQGGGSQQEVYELETLPSDEQETIIAIMQSDDTLTHKLDRILPKGDITPRYYSTIQYLLSLYPIEEGKQKSFLDEFIHWIHQMGYTKTQEIAQEFQFRLSTLLGFEDEYTESSALLQRVSTGLQKTRTHFTQRILQLLGENTQFDSAFWDDFEEICITSDIGVTATQMLIAKLQERVGITTKIEEFRTIFAETIQDIFTFPERLTNFPKPEVVMVVGVNGAGKTTTIGKLAAQYKQEGKKVLLIGADTFRAAAVEQLAMWAERTGTDFFSKEQGSDPASVAFEGIQKGKAEGSDIIFVDTAGRLHTKTNLMEELKKVARVIEKVYPGTPHRIVIVLDATIGQNALSQVALFNQACPISEVILTKIDGTAKGGIAIAIAMEYKIPLTYVGVGEKVEDLQKFDPKVFTEALLGDFVGESKVIV